MRLNRIYCVMALSIVALPTAAAEIDAAVSTTVTNDLKRLSATTILPAIRQEGSVRRDQILCLALAMYHEARGETEGERLAVAQVIYNRALHSNASVCNIVWADNGSQFQWVKATSTIVPREPSAWAAIQNSALRFARHRPADTTHGATNFFNPELCSPSWAKGGQVTVLLRQVFMRLDGKKERFAGKVSVSDPISQLDELGRRRPTRAYSGGRS